MFFIFCMCILNMVCLFEGIRIGQKVSKGEDITLPNPIKAVKQYRATKEHDKEQKEVQIMLENINNYDGTALGQKDIEE